MNWRHRSEDGYASPGYVSRRARSHCAPQLFVWAVILLIFCCIECAAQTKRLVVIKCDGLPFPVVDKFVKERDPRTGKSMLPWFDYIFYQHGARLSNFYVRGMSLSAPSWSLLDTGQHLQIKGNVEFDRYTLHTYDYLNFIPFYISGVVGARVDMPAVEVLDSLGIPLLADAFPHDQRYITLSLYQRGPRYATLQNGLQNRFKKSPKELFDEWTMGFELRNAVTDQLVHELVDKLNDPKVRYLDLLLADFDHVAHHNNDLQSQFLVLKQLDATLGEIWTAIQGTAGASHTALIVVSDHGFNSDEKIYSQGYNLVKLLGSREGGGHHVVTKRRLLLDYAIKGIYPLVPLITTTTTESNYLKGQSTEYPTALLDFDGNERASIHLRDSDLNLLHILLQQLQRNDLPPAIRKAASAAFFEAIAKRRFEWQGHVDEIKAELVALGRKIEELRKLWQARPKKFTREEQQAGLDDEATRIFVDLDRSLRQQREYSAYIATLQNLLALNPDSVAFSRLNIPDVIAKNSMGDSNSIYELQNYIVGLGTSGLVLAADGSLDMQRSFARRNYFQLLHAVSVRNNVQQGISNRPIDLIAIRIPSAKVLPLSGEKDIANDVIWLDAGDGKQALIFSRVDKPGELYLRYQPISNLTQDENGQLHFDIVDWQPGLPLKMLEDPNLSVPTNDRKAWLSAWHTDLEWLHALHRTEYSNGLIGLHEQLARHPIERLADDYAVSDDDRLLRRFARRQREIVEADMLVVANNHWNFDVRGFNPGGNHGSFFRISTHSTFLIAGGPDTKLPAGVAIDEPYDSLSFVPTLLALAGDLRDDRLPISTLWDRGFRRFPGRVVKELIPPTVDSQIVVTGASASP